MSRDEPNRAEPQLKSTELLANALRLNLSLETREQLRVSMRVIIKCNGVRKGVNASSCTRLEITPFHTATQVISRTRPRSLEIHLGSQTIT
eukprot:1334267-Amorphochlora_amoeboformis.AAC.1